MNNAGSLFNHGLIADIPGVENVIDTLKVSPDSWIE